ncbi:MAG: 4Fe-4S dicluster domain-containing protein [Polyangiaceae bacterium]|nr:4Fe-4S dicluster domain-containing protein [Polyangiaceae bacterium]
MNGCHAEPGAACGLPLPDTHAEQLVELRRKGETSRRGLLAGAAAAATATAAAGCDITSVDQFLQKHYTELTDDDKKQIFARLEAQVKERSGVTVKIGDPQPIEGVTFGYALNLSICNGNRRCVEACARENNLPNHPEEMRYIRVLEVPNGALELEKSDPYFEGEVPKSGKYYLPVQCHQCANPPCVRQCPCEATWKEPDGLIVVDYDWCIGCRYCQAACPYHARRFNYGAPTIEPDRINPNQAYLSNRIRPVGVIEKCTFCLQRTRVGRFPACLEACPTGARKFGDLNDPNGELRKILATKRVYVLKEDLGTIPHFYYFFA